MCWGERGIFSRAQGRSSQKEYISLTKLAPPPPPPAHDNGVVERFLSLRAGYPGVIAGAVRTLVIRVPLAGVGRFSICRTAMIRHDRPPWRAHQQGGQKGDQAIARALSTKISHVELWQPTGFLPASDLGRRPAACRPADKERSCDRRCGAQKQSPPKPQRAIDTLQPPSDENSSTQAIRAIATRYDKRSHFLAAIYLPPALSQSGLV